MPEEKLVNVQSGREFSSAVQDETTHHRRYARAEARVLMEEATASKVESNAIAKGDVLGCARIAGIQAAKRAAELIPTALPVLIGGVRVDFVIRADRIEVEAVVEADDRLGVATEALTACSVAALTIYDMCKAIDRSMTVAGVTLTEEGEGDSVTWRRGVPED